MFVKLNKLPDINVKLKSENLNKELDKIPGIKFEEFIVANGITADDWEFKEKSEIVSVNLDNVLYIKPYLACIDNLFNITDEKLMKSLTWVQFKNREFMYVEDDFDELSKKLSE